MIPLEMKKGRALADYHPRRERLRQFEYARMDNMGRVKNWWRKQQRLIPAIQRHPFHKSIMSWRYGTTRERWNDVLRPLVRFYGDHHENRSGN